MELASNSSLPIFSSRREGLRIVTTDAEVKRRTSNANLLLATNRHLRQLRSALDSQFSRVRRLLPQCHALVMRIGAFNRISGALLIGGALLVFGGLVVLALRAVAGTAGFVVGVVLAVTASVGGAVSTYRAVRLHRTIARPVRDYARGLVRP